MSLLRTSFTLLTLVSAKDVITLGNYMRLIGMPDALANATNFVLTSSRDETPTQTENDEKKLELVFDGFINVETYFTFQLPSCNLFIDD